VLPLAIIAMKRQPYEVAPRAESEA
jgi:hypothetical protein